MASRFPILQTKHPASAIPSPPSALVDRESRAVHYLRLSVTDRCNLRCRYCMPAAGLSFARRNDILSFEEIERLVRLFVSRGVTHLRLTGGEPLVRTGILDLIARLASIEGVRDFAMSTNAFLLDTMAADLHAAGLRRVNISIDTLRPERFEDIARVGGLDRVLRGIDAAIEAGLGPVKLNAVVLRGVNDDELADLVHFAAERGAIMRFIEHMPIGVDGFWTDARFMSTADILERLAPSFHGTDSVRNNDGISVIGGGPARYATLTCKATGRASKVGFISALSDHFCATCNRVRVTATGTLQECLAIPGHRSLRDAMRAGASDTDISHLLDGALLGKGPGHDFSPLGGGVRTLQSMSVTGG